MSDASKQNSGPKRKLSDSVRKRNRRELNAKNNKQRIYIGDQHNFWMELKDVFLRVETHVEAQGLVTIHVNMLSMYKQCIDSIFTWIVTRLCGGSSKDSS